MLKEKAMNNKEQIMIDGVEYNPCNGCKLWNGHHCIGARSYEPNADEHKAICNEHIANQFHKVYQQLYRKTQECEALKSESFTVDSLITVQEEEIEELKRKVELMMDCPDCKVDEYKKALEEIKELANCGKDMYIERGKYPDYEAMAEWMKNQFVFILDIINKAKGDINEAII